MTYHHHNCMELELNGYFIGVSELKDIDSERFKAFSCVCVYIYIYTYIYIYIFFFSDILCGHKM